MSYESLVQLQAQGDIPRHVAIIMDGNGRWARKRFLPRTAGHHRGMTAVREAVDGSIDAGVEFLTLFAFSQENWNRPAAEVSALMNLLNKYITREAENLLESGVRVRILGDRSRLARSALQAVERVESETADGTVLQLGLCVCYSAREEITRAARSIADDVASGKILPEDVSERTVEERLYTASLPDPDLLVRTSGEQRVSNFLLWQLAYTELYVTPVLWPDFTRRHLFEAILDFQDRERRFGKVSA